MTDRPGSTTATEEILRILRALRAYLPELRLQYGVSTLELFGSYARGDQEQDRNLDLLVEFDRTPSLFEFVDLQYSLGDLLGIKVDLVMKDALKPDLAPFILEDRIPV
jgi:predicted nucleotidyltransferase